MKKILLALAMMITLATGAFASDEKINPAVESAFKSKFPDAADVEWLAGPNYYKATFTYNNARLSAIYTEDAALMGLTRYISSTQLPYYLQSKLKKSFTHYWITDLFEMSGEDGFGYYLTMQNADNKIVLESKDGSDWKIISIS